MLFPQAMWDAKAAPLAGAQVPVKHSSHAVSTQFTVTQLQLNRQERQTSYFIQNF